MGDPVDVTVAVCTWNRAALLDQTLASLAAQRVPAGVRWELVVVDNNSTDATPAVLARHAGGPLPLRPVREARQGHCHARNRALAEARGAWVAWTDDDVQVGPGWVAAYADLARRRPDAAAAGGPVEPWFPQPPDPDLAEAFPPLGIGYCGIDHGPAERDLGPAEHVYGANMAYNAAATAGLRFDPAYGRRGTNQAGGDDLDFLTRARGRGPAVWAPAARVRHYVEPTRMTFAYARRYVRDGVRPPAGPRDPAPHLLGVPRWLVRQYLAAVAAGWRPGRRRADRLRSRLLGSRLAAQMAHYRRAAAAGFPPPGEGRL